MSVLVTEVNKDGVSEIKHMHTLFDMGEKRVKAFLTKTYEIQGLNKKTKQFEITKGLFCTKCFELFPEPIKKA